MNLIDQYVSTATFHLPESERCDAAKELKSIIKNKVDDIKEDLTDDEKIKK